MQFFQLLRTPVLAVTATILAAAGAAYSATKDPAPAGKPAATTNAPAAAPVAPAPVVPTVVQVPVLSATQSMKTMQMQPGYRLELIASEPAIISPVCMAWDGNGAMYVAEMRTYMLDVNGGKTMEPKSRITRLESTKGDGIYDKVTVFADGLLLPRQILCLDDRILVRETNSKDLWAFRDTNGDGVSDEKVKFYEGGGSAGNLEHQSSNLTWNIDNWMYHTVDQTRFRYTRGKVEVDRLPFKTGQWGYGVDDVGRLYFSTAGSERPAHDFQVPLTYGQIALKGELAPDFTKVYPLVKLADVQGGPGRVSPGGGLNRFTGSAGPSIYRGEALPADLYGDLLIPEPVGRLIRRAKVTVEEGRVTLKNAYVEKEFIASTDPNFRPVWSATGPDGLIYFCDMYHGIIQESNWTKEGSYLRPQILKNGLDKNINAGRIYRLTHESAKPRSEKPHMLSETAAQLVGHLRDANGWWRDTAQRLIVLKQDKSVVPALKEMARSDGNSLARLHALWTLEGLDSADSAFLVEKAKDADVYVRAAAARISEPLLAKAEGELAAMVKTLASDASPTVAIQACLSALKGNFTQANEVIAAAIKAHAKNPNVASIVNGYKEAVLAAKADAAKPKHLDKRYAVAFFKGKDLYGQTCIACHGINGKGAPTPEEDGTTLAPPLVGSKRLLASDKGVPIHIALKGMVGPHENGKAYVNEMAGFPWADDQMMSSILTYARNDWGNKADPIEPGDVAKVRKATAKRDRPYTFGEVVEMMAKAITPETSKPGAPVKK